MTFQQNKYIFDKKIRDVEPAGVVSELAGGRIGSSHLSSGSGGQQAPPPNRNQLVDAALIQLN